MDMWGSALLMGNSLELVFIFTNHELGFMFPPYAPIHKQNPIMNEELSIS